jgi:hypothetical protein
VEALPRFYGDQPFLLRETGKEIFLSHYEGTGYMRTELLEASEPNRLTPS